MLRLFDIRRFSVHDGPGIRTTVFFKGCPLQCSWCHNPEGRSPRFEYINRKNYVENKVFTHQEIIGKDYSTKDLMIEIRRDLPFFEESGGGVTFSGGEPLWQPDELIPLLNACKRESIHTAIDTSAYCASDVFYEVARQTDLFLFDIKHSDNQEHIKLTGVSNHGIINNLFLLAKDKIPVIIRIPLIPGMNTDKKNLKGTLKILAEAKASIQRVDVLPYHWLAKEKYRNLQQESGIFEDLTPSVLQYWKSALEAKGFLTVVGG